MKTKVPRPFKDECDHEDGVYKSSRGYVACNRCDTDWELYTLLHLPSRISRTISLLTLELEGHTIPYSQLIACLKGEPLDPDLIGADVVAKVDAGVKEVTDEV